jgi:hypothetical protein
VSATVIEYGYPEKLYHADRTAWSCSALSKWLTDRRDFVSWLAGENVDAPTDEMTFGRYKHAAIFEGMDVARSRFVVAPARGGTGKDAAHLIDRRTKDGKAEWAKFTATLEGREWVRPDLAANVPAMLEALAAHHEAGPLLFPASDGRNEVSIWWTDDVTGVRLRCRLDRLVHLDGVPHLPDLKTTEDASDFAIARTSHRFAYHMKCAMYLDAWRSIYGELAVMPLIFVETNKRPRVNVKWTTVDTPAVNIGRALYRRIIGEILACKAANDWREPFERTERAPLTLPAWVMREHEFSGSDDLEGAEEA